MDGLPSGTVSLLFSDVEGSTLLLRRLGDRWPEALDLHRRLCRDAWTAEGGHELGTEGDSFFVAFGTAGGAVRAAVRAQRALAAAEWPDGATLRVRMGVHTGSPRRHGDGYVGLDVHTAARVAAAAAGGQVLVSEATLRLVTGGLPGGMTARDLGEHRLKDIPGRTRLFRLLAPGLPEITTPPRTLGKTGSLPRQLTSLVGREGELAELRQLLADRAPLLTLTGPGGSGKTRLATALGAALDPSFTSGVYFVDLSSVSTADQMWPAIAAVLDLPDDGHLPPKFFEYVAGRRALLILDNLEQIEAADTVVSALLEHARDLAVVATSRRPLHVLGEREHPVPPLELPKDDTWVQVAGSAAAEMFVEEARRVRPDFALTEHNVADVAAICRHLDGLPLAIELASARSRLLSPRALMARLGDALDIPSSHRDAPGRQKTLRDTVRWSYELLDPVQQALFRTLGIFAGGAHIASVEAVSADRIGDRDTLEVVADLMDVSLVTAAEGADGEPRVTMLDTIRGFALRQLETTGELAAVREAHAHHFRSVADELSVDLHGAPQLAARDRFATDLDNFREALRWSLAPDGAARPSPERTALGLALCNDLFDFWRHSATGEAREWLELAVEHAGAGPGAGDGAGDGVGDSLDLANALAYLAQSLLGRDAARARDLASTGAAMARRLGDAAAESLALGVGGWAEHELDNRGAAVERLREAVAVARRADSSTALATSVLDLSILEGEAGDRQQEIELLTEGRVLARADHDDFLVVLADCNLAAALRSTGRVEEARRLMMRTVPGLLAQHDARMTMGFAEDLAAVLGDLGDGEGCARLLGAADAMRRRLDKPRTTWQDEPLRASFAAARRSLSPSAWEAAYGEGEALTVESALAGLS